MGFLLIKFYKNTKVYFLYCDISNVRFKKKILQNKKQVSKEVYRKIQGGYLL